MKNQKNNTTVNTTATQNASVQMSAFDLNDPKNAIQPVKSAQPEASKPEVSAQPEASKGKTDAPKTDKKTAAQLKTLSYNAYKAIVLYEEQLSAGSNPSLDDLTKAIGSCLRAYGMKDWDKSGTVLMLLQRLVSFGKRDGNTGWKVLGVTTFRKQMTTWAETVEGKGVIYSKNDKKDPSAPKTEKAKKPTKADLEAELAALRAKMAEAEKSSEQKAA